MCVDNVDSKLKGIQTYSESAPICCIDTRCTLKFYNSCPTAAVICNMCTVC